MKAKVIQQYKDKKTKVSHKIGEEINVSNERFEEINSTSHGTFLEEILELKEPEGKEKSVEVELGNDIEGEGNVSNKVNKGKKSKSKASKK